MGEIDRTEIADDARWEVGVAYGEDLISSHAQTLQLVQSVEGAVGQGHDAI